MVRKGMLVVTLALVVGSAAGCTGGGGSDQSQQPETTKQGETTKSIDKTTPKTTPQPKQKREKKESGRVPPEDIRHQARCALEKYANAEHGGDLDAALAQARAEEISEEGTAPDPQTDTGPRRLRKDMADRGYTCTDSEARERANERAEEHQQELTSQEGLDRIEQRRKEYREKQNKEAQERQQKQKD